jgi:hypothetical protein
MTDQLQGKKVLLPRTFSSVIAACLGKVWLLAPSAVLVLSVPCQINPAYAGSSDNTWVGSNSFGGSGLFQTRSARSRPDGHFEAGYSLVDPYKRYYITLQGLPWLEGTFRYTDIRNQLYSPFASFSGQQTFKDRGADITLRLFDEQEFRPAIALTLQDGLGTGQFAGEYLTFSKRYYDFDFSGGIAWGYSASGSTIKNPLASLGERFKTRGSGAGTGGDIKYETYFAGENIAFFGGVAYRTPVKGLVLKFEYDPNDFQNEPSNSKLLATSHFNYGLNYSPFDWMETSLGVERGYELSFRLTMTSDLHTDGMPKFEPPPQALKSRMEVEEDLKNPQAEDEAWPRWMWPGTEGEFNEQKTEEGESVLDAATSGLFEAFKAIGLPISEVDLGEGTSRFVVIGVLPDKEQQDAANIVRIVDHFVPEHSEIITLVGNNSPSSQNSTVSYHRKEIEGEGFIVDFLFDELEAKGLQFVDIEFSHKHVKLRLAQIEDAASPDSRIAELVFNSLPTPVDKLIVELEDGGQTVNRFEFFKEETEREALVDELFEIVETEGLEIQSIDVSQRLAEVWIAGTERNENYKLIRTARRLANVVPMRLDDVIVVAARAGVGVSRIHVRRSAAQGVSGASAGEEWSLVDDNSAPSDSPRPPDWTEEDRLAISSRLFRELSKEGFSTDAVSLDGYRVTIYGNSRKYRYPARNIGHAIRAVSNNIPAEIEEISIVTVSAGFELNRLTIQRQDFEKAVAKTGSIEEVWANANFEKGKGRFSLPDDVIKNDDRYPTMNWLFNPKFRTHIGGPSRFLLYQLYLTAGFDVQFLPGLNMTGRLRRNLYNNFGRIRFGSSSVLPHVRTDIKEYLQESKDFSIDRVQADYFFSPVSDWYGRVSAGIFEEMFGGYSMEVLHRPFKSRLAVGVDINRVWQREYDQRFRFKEYMVNTGHLNLYYNLPWKNISASAHIGQYLAGDRGVTFMGSREFDSGVIFGLWSTFTDVSAEDFGEGSFDKGFYIRIPFDLFLTKSTTQRGTFGFRPITRDGGAKLGMQSALHGIVTSSNVNRLVDHWDKLLD